MNFTAARTSMRWPSERALHQRTQPNSKNRVRPICTGSSPPRRPPKREGIALFEHAGFLKTPTIDVAQAGRWDGRNCGIELGVVEHLARARLLHIEAKGMTVPHTIAYRVWDLAHGGWEIES